VGKGQKSVTVPDYVFWTSLPCDQHILEQGLTLGITEVDFLYLMEPKLKTLRPTHFKTSRCTQCDHRFWEFLRFGQVIVVLEENCENFELLWSIDS
jgi:hypothetical protein